jgi:hypothetical protein
VSSSEDASLLNSTNIFDFIHAVQINFESSQLDKENAHFVLADLAIASAELVKTEHWLEADEAEELLASFITNNANGMPTAVATAAVNFIPMHKRHGSAAASTIAGPSVRTRLASAAIRINNQSVTSSNIRSFEDRSHANSLAATTANRTTDDSDSFSDHGGGARDRSKKRNSVLSGSLKRFQNRLRTSFSTSSLSAAPGWRPSLHQQITVTNATAAASNNKENLILSLNRKFFNSRASIDTLIFQSNDNSGGGGSAAAEARRADWLSTNETVNQSAHSGNSYLFDLSTESNASDKDRNAKLTTAHFASSFEKSG